MLLVGFFPDGIVNQIHQHTFYFFLKVKKHVWYTGTDRKTGQSVHMLKQAIYTFLWYRITHMQAHTIRRKHTHTHIHTYMHRHRHRHTHTDIHTHTCTHPTMSGFAS